VLDSRFRSADGEKEYKLVHKWVGVTDKELKEAVKQRKNRKRSSFIAAAAEAPTAAEACCHLAWSCTDV